ncbi:MAG: hypothetical protein U0904_11515 [Candidatus Nanopelagicales bacterium]|nr:hypothetical protein [Candidatus Nanopelagicales bacterium]
MKRRVFRVVTLDRDLRWRAIPKGLHLSRKTANRHAEARWRDKRQTPGVQAGWINWEPLVHQHPDFPDHVRPPAHFGQRGSFTWEPDDN